MKILMTVDPEIPVPPVLYGGIERIVDGLIKEYAKAGHQVHLLANESSKVGCKLIPWWGKSSRNNMDTLKNTIQLTLQVIGNQYDVVHSFSRLAYLLPILKLNVPKIMSYQREPFVPQIKKAFQMAKKETLVFTGCSGYISNQIAKDAIAFPIFNFTETEKYTFVPSVQDDAPLAFLGRIEPVKGTHLAIQIALKTKKKLLIAGNVPSDKKEYFDKEISPYLNDDIQYIGPVDDEGKNKLLMQSSALLMPIEWNEPFGIVMVEAMACGTPVIGFAKGAVPEVVVHGLNGFTGNTLEDLVEGVNNIGKIDRKKVRKYMEEHFSSSVIANEYLDLYHKLQSKAIS